MSKYDNSKEGIALWVKECLEPCFEQMPSSCMEHLDYVDEPGHGQYIVVTYRNGYQRKANVSADSARACIIDLYKQDCVK